jgi:hypothetical protein
VRADLEQDPQLPERAAAEMAIGQRSDLPRDKAVEAADLRDVLLADHSLT